MIYDVGKSVNQSVKHTTHSQMYYTQGPICSNHLNVDLNWTGRETTFSFCRLIQTNNIIRSDLSRNVLATLPRNYDTHNIFIIEFQPRPLHRTHCIVWSMNIEIEQKHGNVTNCVHFSLGTV